MSILLNEITSQYISTYFNYKTNYPKLCVLIQIGLFYEILEISNGNITMGNAKEIADLLDLNIVQKYSENNSSLDINPHFCGFSVESSKFYITKLLRNEYVVIKMKHVKNKETNLHERVITNIYKKLDDL